MPRDQSVYAGRERPKMGARLLRDYIDDSRLAGGKRPELSCAVVTVAQRGACSAYPERRTTGVDPSMGLPATGLASTRPSSKAATPSALSIGWPASTGAARKSPEHRLLWIKVLQFLAC